MASDNSANNRRIARNTTFLYGRMVVVLLVTLYTSRAVLHALGAEDYGVYNVVGSLATMFSFLNSTLSGAAQRFYNYEQGGRGRSMRQVYVASVRISAVLALLLLAAMEGFGIWYINHVMVVPDGRLAAAHWVYQFSCAGLILSVLELPFTSILLAREKMDSYAIVSVAEVLLRLGLVILLPHLPADKLAAYAGINLLLGAFSFTIYCTLALKSSPEVRRRDREDPTLLREMVSFSGWNILGTMATLLKGNGVNMLLNYFFGTMVNAARGISYQVLSALSGFTANIALAFRPQLISSYAAGDIDRTRRLAYSQSKICYMLACTLIVPLCLEIDYVLGLWLGRDMVPPYASVFAVLVMTDMMINTLNGPLTQISYATGKVKHYQLAAAITHAAIIPIALGLLALGAGPTSAFVVCIAMTVANQTAGIVIVNKLFPLKVGQYLSRIILPCLTYTLLLPLLPGVVRLALDESLLRLALVLLCDGAAALGIGYFVVLSREERDMVAALIPEKVKTKLTLKR